MGMNVATLTPPWLSLNGTMTLWRPSGTMPIEQQVLTAFLMLATVQSATEGVQASASVSTPSYRLGSIF